MKKKALHIIVKGKVQGVFYRKTTHKKAIELGLTGWVKNLRDGSVEIEVEGPESQMVEFVTWCATGPKNAEVSQLIQQEIEGKGFKDFSIMRD